MADDRNEWLDQVTAELLLRGEPVGDLGDLGEPARTEAVRLAEALRAAAEPEAVSGLADEELPGEDAAVAAFRAVGAARAEGAKPGTRSVVAFDAVGSDDDGDEKPGLVTLGAVRTGTGTGTGTRSREGRSGSGKRRPVTPLRLGFVAAVAGFAIGGVAVASGADFLPYPFDDTSTSATGRTVPGGTGDTSAGPLGDGPGEANRTPGGSDHEGPSGVPSRPVKGTGIGQSERTGGDKPRRIAKACRDYRAGSVAPKALRLLEREAKGRAWIAAYCDRILGRSDGTRPGAGSGDARGSQGNGPKTEHDHGHGHDHGPGNGGKGNGNGQGGANGNANGNGGGNGQDNGNGNGNGGANGNGDGYGNANGQGGGQSQGQGQGQETRPGQAGPPGHDPDSGPPTRYLHQDLDAGTEDGVAPSGGPAADIGPAALPPFVVLA
ncbi:hypothetical protein ABZ714_06155 [Streptomyces sp. NPDC006798]|uniref:hypothetical protein n=1 Tax=Streptomyces sp. NPDC006798 TaxID=3155462 RepID=UPI00340EBDBE